MYRKVQVEIWRNIEPCLALVACTQERVNKHHVRLNSSLKLSPQAQLWFYHLYNHTIEFYSAHSTKQHKNSKIQAILLVKPISCHHHSHIPSSSITPEIFNQKIPTTSNLRQLLSPNMWPGSQHRYL